VSNQALSGTETIEAGGATWRETFNKNLQILDRFMDMNNDVVSESPGGTGWTTIKTYSIPNFLLQVFPFTGHGFQATASVEFANTPSEVKDVRFAIQRDSDAVIPLLTMGSVAHAAGQGATLELNVTVGGTDIINSWGIVTYTKTLALNAFAGLVQQQALLISTASTIKVLLQGNVPTTLANLLIKDFRVRLLK